MKRFIKKILIVTHLWALVMRVRVYKAKKIDYKLNKKKVDNVANKANLIIEEVCGVDKDKLVYIFQHSYYTKDGAQYISGGGERYATDLGRMLKDKGYRPVLIQLGLENSDAPWNLTHGELAVIGLNIKASLFNMAIEKLIKPRLAIYSGYVDFGENLFSPNIMISHGITWDNPLIDVDSNRILEMLKPIDELVSVDTNTISWLRSTFANYFSTHKTKMKYIPNYVDLDLYKRGEEKETKEINIIFPRRLSPERGVWMTFKVLPEILSKYPNVKFDFIGFIHTADIEKTLKNLMEKYPNRISHRFVASDEMNKVYENADITLIPTLYSEGTSLSCIEAMASGNLVISTNIGGLPNLIINDFNGILINPDEKELLSAIDKAISDSEYRERLRSNAVCVSKEFSKEKWEERWNAVLSEALNE